MIQFEHNGLKLCDGMTRREWLRLGSLAATGLSLPQFYAAQARAANDEAPRQKATAKACIQLFLWGGPGQQETWDLKPQAPAGTRGAFAPIDTSVPGFQICEHLPLMAQRAHRYTIIRSLTHTGINHGTSAYHMLTGHVHSSPGTLRHPTKFDMPNIGCNAARFLEHPDDLPALVQMPAIINDGDALPVPGQEPGILGEKHVPFRVLGDLTQRDFQVPSLQLVAGLSPGRLERRVELREAIDGHLAHLAAEHSGRAVDNSYQRAVSLLASSKTQAAFDLSREPDELRERYGKHHFAQALLLARRVVEAGVPFVTVYWNWPNNSSDQSWDTHSDQHRRLGKHLLPAFDRAVSAFLDDLTERGLLEETLVTWYGEFGRTPKINSQGGRDHWGFCQSIGLAGGGVQPGLAYGSSTRDGGYADTLPVSPDDLSATIFHCLGIDYRQHMYDQGGRPIQLSFGEPVRDILG
jgi:hypothetical protein